MSRQKVTLRIVRSDGAEMTLGNGPWRIVSDGLENWSSVPHSVSGDELPTHDGGIITSRRVSMVDRTVEAIAEDPKRNAELRAAAIRFFNPKYDYEAHLTYMGRTRWCRGVQYAFKVSEGNVYQPAELAWTILCPNPFLLSENDFGKDIAEVAPRFGFPFMSFIKEQSVEGVNSGFVASARLFSRSVYIRNGGDVPSGVRLVVKASGNVENPAVRLGDGWVRLVSSMESGDVLEIDADSKPPRVALNGENAMNRLDRNSSILNLMLPIGGSEIEYTADEGDSNMSVTVYYNEQYLGA